MQAKRVCYLNRSAESRMSQDMKKKDYQMISFLSGCSWYCSACLPSTGQGQEMQEQESLVLMWNRTATNMKLCSNKKKIRQKVDFLFIWNISAILLPFCYIFKNYLKKIHVRLGWVGFFLCRHCILFQPIVELSSGFLQQPRSTCTPG